MLHRNMEDIFLKIQVNILEMQTTLSEMKNTLDIINDILCIAEEKIRKLENRNRNHFKLNTKKKD